MKFFSTPNEKKSAIITLLIGFLLILIFFVFGLTFLDPPISYGVEVNFGKFSDEKLNKKVDFESSKTPLKNTILNNNFNNSELKFKAVVQKKSNVSIEDKSSNPETKKKSLDKNKLEQKDSLFNDEVKKRESQISELTKKVLKNIISAQEITELDKNNILVDNEDKIDSGNPYSSTYYSQIGLIGEEVGFGLNGRNLESNGAVKPECNEEGKVVVRIIVNKTGNVINAEAGVKGSTNVHPCLLGPAKKTAFLHKWFSDDSAPDSQIGFVVVNFKLVD